MSVIYIHAGLVRRRGEAGSEKSCGSGPFVLWEVVGAGHLCVCDPFGSPGRLLGTRMDGNRATLRTRSFIRGLEPRTLVDSGRGEDDDELDDSRHVRGIEQQLVFDCCCDSDLSSPGRSTSTLCVSSVAQVFSSIHQHAQHQELDGLRLGI